MSGLKAALVFHFPKDQTLVRPSALMRYIRWNLSRSPGCSAKLRRMAAMLLTGRIGMAGVDPDRLERLRPYLGAAWARYASDGGRIQVFNPDKAAITKVSLQPDKTLMDREVRARKRMGSAVPSILNYDIDAGVLEEAWIPLCPAAPGHDTLRKALAVLRERLYAPVEVDTTVYLRNFPEEVAGERTLAYLRTREMERLLVSEVHGDLWPGNLGLDSKGGLILLDWEYARVCVQSHDVWLFLFQDQHAKAKPYDRAFLQMFANCYAECFGVTCSLEEASCLHLLHLIERYSLFKTMELTHKSEELRDLMREITRILKE